MSNSVWHKPSETTDVDNNLIIDDWTNRTYELGYFDDNDMIFRNFRNDDTYFEESMMRWCDVNDLIDDYDRTHKALKIAIDLLKRIDETRSSVKENLHATNCRTLDAGNGFCWATIDDINDALKQIIVLTGGDDNV